MYCSNCSSPLDPNTGICTACGLQHAMPEQPKAAPQQPAYSQPPVVPQQPVYTQSARTEMTEDELPEKFRPLGAWSYFWLSVLFSVPVVGFIFLIIFSFNDGNRNRRSFARSYWCALLIVGIFAIIAAIILVVAGVSFAELLRSGSSSYYYY